MLSLGAKNSGALEPSLVSSQLLPQLFLGYDQDTAPAAILDVGTGGSHTLEAFAFYRSKVYFLDLFAQSIPQQGSNKRQQAYAHRAFTEALSDCRGVVFDLCLFWELLQELTEPALRGLSSALQPFLGPSSRGYAVGQIFADAQGQGWRYRIEDAQQLARWPLDAASQPKFADGWSQFEFAGQFDCLQVTADRLGPDGRLELLFAPK